MSASEADVTAPDWPPVRERWTTTALRTGGLAVMVGIGAGWLRRDWTLVPLATLVALWFTLGGHFVELAFRNKARYLLSPHPAAQAVARLAWWFAGGVILLKAMVLSWTILSSRDPTIWPWWVGGVMFVFVELTVHTMLWATRQASFFNGRG